MMCVHVRCGPGAAGSAGPGISMCRPGLHTEMGDSPDFQRLFESVPGAYLVLDPRFRVVAATDAYLAAAHTTRGALMGRDLLEVFPANTEAPDGSGTQSLRESLETVVRSRVPHRMAAQKYDIPRASAMGGGFEERYWNPVNTPVIENDEVRWIIHAVEDVTNDVRLEELRGENEQTSNQLSNLQEADRAKDEFIAIISHELRTPMTSILGWTRMLSLGNVDDETRLEALEALERATLAQAKLIEDLLDESRIAAGKLRLEQRGMDLCAAVESAVSMARPSAEAKNIALSFECEEGSHEVFADPARLQQAIGNLLGNAIKFSGEGGSVTARLGRRESAAVIDVSDSGRGIPASLLPHIFDRFRQGDGQRAERQSGLGLGLSITRHVVEMHGGTVSVTSEGEGRGSTFTITLPLHEKHGGEHDLIGRDAPGRRIAVPDLRGLRVLIVEDEADNRRVLSAALGHCGAELQCTDTACAAFDVVNDWNPDVIICDIALPDLDGCSFLTQLRSRETSTGRKVPALALTVLGREGEQARIIDAGFDVFRQKPIDPFDLAHEVARLSGRPSFIPAAQE